ncbi:MAG: sigma-70 family RNA polymerase sigma factor [Clostridia bacterium]|nr:sigma-70 family RNA polymerase sigma factor [Clostridia bacterium]
MSLFGRKGKAEAFEELAALHERAVYLLCLRMMGNREDALDCAQEAMLNAYRAFDRFQGDNQGKSWFLCIAHHVCIDSLRKRRNIISLDTLREEGFDPADAKQLSPYARLEQKERMALLQQAVQELPEEQKSVVELRDFQDLSYDEIGEVLGIPLGTVKSRLKRAREKIKQILCEKSELFSEKTVKENEGRRK